MARTSIRIFGAACSAMLLYLSFDFTLGAFLSIAAVFTLLSVMDNVGPTLKCALISVFYCVFICAQWKFIIAEVMAEEAVPAMLLILLAAFIVHIIPACLCLISFRRKEIEAVPIAILLSEFVFVCFELGDQCFQIGASLASIPSCIQFYKITGLWGGSAFIVFSAYFLYRSVHNPKWIIPLLGMISTIACLNIIEESDNEGKIKKAKICLVSLGKEKERVEKAGALINDAVASNCDYILWPEGVVSRKESAFMFDPLITRCKRLSDKYGAISYFGLNTGGGHQQTNSIITIKKGETARRFKEHLIPFSEYLPYESLLGRIPTIRNNILYPLLSGHTSYVMSENENICPLICYESLSTDYICTQANKGAELFFVSSSNEYIDCKHMEKVIMRILQSNAVIVNRDIARSATNGFSMLVDNVGRVSEMPYSSTGLRIVTSAFSTDKTFYATYKRAVDVSYGIFLIIMLVVCRIFASEKRP